VGNRLSLEFYNGMSAGRSRHGNGTNGLSKNCPLPVAQEVGICYYTPERLFYRPISKVDKLQIYGDLAPLQSGQDCQRKNQVTNTAAVTGQTPIISDESAPHVANTTVPRPGYTAGTNGASPNGQTAHAGATPTRKYKRLLHPGTYDQLICLPDGKWLGDMVFNLPARCIITAGVGTGKTTFAAEWHGPSILVVPTKAKIAQMLARFPNAMGYYGDCKQAIGNEGLIITTPDSLPALVKLIMQHGGRASYTLWVDEIHCMVTAGYRRRAYKGVYNEAKHPSWHRVVLMTGTPMPLPGSEFDSFYTIGVESLAQVVRATRYHYAPGRQLKTAVSLIERGKKYLLMLNNKGKQLRKLIALIVAAGYTRSEIGVLNADMHESELYKSVIGGGVIPDGIKIVVTTSVIGEGVDLNQYFDAVMILSRLSQEEAQQIVGRARPGVGQVCWFSNAEGTEGPFDEAKERAELYRRAQNHVDAISWELQVNPRMTDKVIREHSIVSDVMNLNSLIEFVDNPFFPYKVPAVSHVGIANGLAYLKREHDNQNPQVFKDGTADRFGWEWGPDVAIALPDDQAGDAAIKEEIDQEMAIAEAEFIVIVEDIRAEGLHNPSMGSLSPRRKRAREWGERLYRILPDNDAACNLLLHAGESQQRINTVANQLEFQVNRSDPQADGIGNDFYHRTKIGERMTPLVMNGRVQLSCMNWPALRKALRDGSVGEPALTNRMAVEIMALFFELKRCKIVVNGKRVDGWEIVSDNPLKGIVP
jgi:hypothetical protein